jgi:hypothetical protein
MAGGDAGGTLAGGTADATGWLALGDADDAIGVTRHGVAWPVGATGGVWFSPQAANEIATPIARKRTGMPREPPLPA